MKVGFVSLGCCKNLVDSEKIMGMLRAGGHTLTTHPSEAEAIIINTCGFIDSAKEEAISVIFEMAAYKKQKLQKLIVLGCLAQRYQEALKKEIPEIDRVIAIQSYPMLHEILKQELGNVTLPSFKDSERLLATKPWSGYLKIAEGCSNHCTYCAIPSIRGDNVSFPMEKLVEEGKRMAANGVKELVLIAQDTTKYGVDLYQRRSLSELLRQLNAITELHWIRVLYMYPDEIDEELIQTMAELDKVLPYFDIPLQHANDRMLKLMNRRGTMHEVKDLLALIRKHCKQPTLRTTFIVGFPQEDEAAFHDLMTFVEATKWDRMGAFAYSREEDTAAYAFAGQVDAAVAQQRLNQLMELQADISAANLKQRIGETVEVLVEGLDALSGRYRGRDRSSAPDEVDGLVFFTSSEHIPLGSFVQVTITDALVHDLIGVAHAPVRV